MPDRALIHFATEHRISVGIYLENYGLYVPDLLRDAAPMFDPFSPGRCVSGFCSAHHSIVTDLLPPPPEGWKEWGFPEWDRHFGWNNGTYIIDLPYMRVRQYHPISVHRRGREVNCDLSRTPPALRVIS